ncbi:MAG: Gfo/Idh/MocA family oxidoreductase [Candidatus Paceibacterota bacterium]
MTRRNLLKGAAVGLTTNFFPKSVFGANDRINIGFIGTGGMGRSNMRQALNHENARVYFLCDVFEDNLAKAIDEAKAHSPKTTRDFRRVLDDRNIDAVCIGTPDHWHAYMAVEAMKRKMHVYCEKPIARTVEEIKLMMAAGKKYGVVFQSGQWQRSGNQFIKAVDHVRSGIIGGIHRCQTWLHWQDGGIGSPADSVPPEKLGYWGWNMHLGPAPYREFNENRFLYKWRFFWDYANGMAGDWGPHTIDIGQWAMDSKGPLSVVSLGDIKCVNDNRETPTIWFTSYQFKGFQLLFDHNACSPAPEGNKKNGSIEFIGENGSIFVDRSFCSLKDRDGKEVEGVKADGKAGYEHWRDFLEHVRDNDLDTRTSLERVGPTNISCLLAAAAFKYGNGTKQLDWNPETMTSSNEGIDPYLGYSYRAPWKLEI